MNSRLSDKFSHFTDAIDLGIETENWYAALVVALTLPDICGYLDDPDQKSSKRYVKWFNTYMTPKYTTEVGAKMEKHTFLNGNDAYALRCAYLHSGTFHTDDQWIKDALRKFRFVTTQKNNKVHKNQNGQSLQLQVDEFCWDIRDAVNQWIKDSEENQNITSLIDNMIEIEKLENSFTL